MGVNNWLGGASSGAAAVSWVKRDGKGIPGKGSIMCKGPGAAGIGVCSRNCRRRRGRRPGRWADVTRPCNQWGRSHVRLYPQGSEKPWKGFKLGETQRGAF